jgi:alanyl-tRNA synthetase
VAVIGVADSRCAIAIAVTADLTTRFSAADLIRRAVPAMGGQGGGGKPDFAQGGAPDGALAEAGLEAVRAALG